MVDLRPIALCNVVYKIMAKIIVNKMKPMLKDVISESQSVFVPNKLITNNIMIDAKAGHFLRRKQTSKVGWVVMKLDIAKAYDQMERAFLEKMMTRMGFANKWVDTVMLCVTIVRYNVLVNGGAGGTITPTHGLKQGDLLSPYLFIIFAKGLSVLLQKAQMQGTFHGCRVARGAPIVSHIFFVDDSFLFFKAKEQDAMEIKHYLSTYEKLSGQVNFHKSSISFSGNTQEDDRETVTNLLNVPQDPDFGKYLGLPFVIGCIRESCFSYIEQKLGQRIGSWSKKFLFGLARKFYSKLWLMLCPLSL